MHIVRNVHNVRTEHIVRTMQRSANLLLTSTRSQLGFFSPMHEWPALAVPTISELQPFSGAVEAEEEPPSRGTNR